MSPTQAADAVLKLLETVTLAKSDADWLAAQSQWNENGQKLLDDLAASGREFMAKVPDGLSAVAAERLERLSNVVVRLYQYGFHYPSPGRREVLFNSGKWNQNEPERNELQTEFFAASNAVNSVASMIPTKWYGPRNVQQWGKFFAMSRNVASKYLHELEEKHQARQVKGGWEVSSHALNHEQTARIESEMHSACTSMH